jgi:hypothetical protein
MVAFVLWQIDDDYENIYKAWDAIIDINDEMWRTKGMIPMNIFSAIRYSPCSCYGSGSCMQYERMISGYRQSITEVALMSGRLPPSNRLPARPLSHDVLSFATARTLTPSRCDGVLCQVDGRE